jgi:probable phosphoglycerate mutase
MNKTLYLIRHGLTDWNLQQKMQGHTNIPLNDTGKAQAQALQVFFAQNPVEKVFSSDLDRAFQTAQIATGAKNIFKMEGIREVRLGEIEGQTQIEISSKYGQEAWLQWTSLEPQANYAFPGGETHRESLQRFMQNLKHIFIKHEFKKAAACTHGLMIRRLGHHLCPDRQEILPIPNCGVFELHWKNQQLHFQGLIFNP